MHLGCSGGFDLIVWEIPHLVSSCHLQGISSKSDANHDASKCGAASGPNRNSVAIKTVVQQGIQCVHRLREGLKEEHIVCTSLICRSLVEYRVALCKSPKGLREQLADILEDASHRSMKAIFCQTWLRRCNKQVRLAAGTLRFSLCGKDCSDSGIGTDLCRSVRIWAHTTESVHQGRL